MRGHVQSFQKLLPGLLLGVVLSIAALLAYDTVRTVQRSPQASATALARPPLGFSVDPQWVLDGRPNFRNIETARSPNGRFISGVWECDGPSTFQWRFFMDEVVYVLEGQVDVEYFGQRFTLRPGMTATFLAGTQALWHVPAGVKKTYTLEHPGRLALWWRKLKQSLPASA
jgi:uncharacterized protein